MLCYHGTSIDHLESIQEHGLLCCPPDRIWSVSENAVYFWCKDGLFQEYDDINDEILIYHSLNQALTSCAFAKNATPICIEFEIDDDLVEADQSCENADHANCTFEDVRPDQIKNIFIGPDLNLYKIFLMKAMHNRTLLHNSFNNEELTLLDHIEDDWYAVYNLMSEKLYDYHPLEMAVYS